MKLASEDEEHIVSIFIKTGTDQHRFSINIGEDSKPVFAQPWSKIYCYVF